LAASVSSFQASVRKPAGSIASRVSAAVRRKLVAGPGERMVRLAAAQHDVEGRKPAAWLQHAPDLAIEPRPV